jgi:hypothetical protein
MSCASFLAVSSRAEGDPSDASAESAVSKYLAAAALSAASEERNSTSRAMLWTFMRITPRMDLGAGYFLV